MFKSRRDEIINHKKPSIHFDSNDGKLHFDKLFYNYNFSCRNRDSVGVKYYRKISEKMFKSRRDEIINHKKPSIHFHSNDGKLDFDKLFYNYNFFCRNRDSVGVKYYRKISEKMFKSRRDEIINHKKPSIPFISSDSQLDFDKLFYNYKFFV